MPQNKRKVKITMEVEAMVAGSMSHERLAEIIAGAATAWPRRAPSGEVIDLEDTDIEIVSVTVRDESGPTPPMPATDPEPPWRINRAD